MRANRLVHALTVSSPGGHFWDDVYSRVPERPEGIPFNILLTYFYLRMSPGEKTASRLASIIKNHRKLVGPNSKILIDSGVYSLNAKYGVDIRNETVDSLGITPESIVNEGIKQLQMYKDYANDYADLLSASADWWDYAVDFDADIFLGSDNTDEIHETIVKRSGLSRKRFIRVAHHVARPNATAWYIELCKDDRYEYVALDGGMLHKRDPNFYGPLVDLAHKYNKKVHVFAVSSPSFTQKIPIDTFDSTSHLSGGRFGRLFTPWGDIDFSRKGIKPPTYESLSNHLRKVVDKYITSYGLTVEEIIASPYSRNLANIWFMNKYWDGFYIERKQSISLFNILEA